MKRFRGSANIISPVWAGMGSCKHSKNCPERVRNLFKNTGDAFVDVSYLGSSSTYEQLDDETFQANQRHHQESAVENMKLSSQCWERLRFSTEGAIYLSKSFWVLMGWHWSKGKATLLPSELCPAMLKLSEGYILDDPVTVPRISPFNSYRTLGVHISPCGSPVPALKVLRGKAEDYAQKINASTIAREDALRSYLQYFIPKINFPLPVLSLTESQCSMLQSPALTAVIAKLHLNRHTA
jgi:hypothetical protein